MLLTTIALVVFQTRLLGHAQRFVSVRGKATRSDLLDIGAWKWLGFAFVGLYVVFGALLPMLALILRAFTSLLTPLVNPFDLLTLDNFRLIFDYAPYTESIVNSITVAFVGAVAVTLFGTVVVLVARRSDFRFARLLETTAQSPHAVPGLIVGIGLFWAFTWIPGGDAVRGTLFALIIAFGIRALPSAYGAISPATMQLGAELDNAARVGMRRRLVAHGVPDHAPSPRARDARLVPAHLDPDDPRVRPRHVPRRSRVTGHRHHRHRSVDPG